MSRDKPYLDVWITARIVTDADSCAGGDAPNELTVETLDAGGGFYPVIKTERFACDSPAQMAAVLAAVVAARASLEQMLRVALHPEHTPKEQEQGDAN